MYIPKNKIITDLYTNGEEYQISNGQGYVGPYYKLYTGKVYAGKNPSSTPNQIELFPYQEQPTGIDLVTKAITPSFSDADGPPYPSGFSDDDINIQLNQSYIYLKTQKLDTEVYNTPYQAYPQPTQDDYNLGVFVRYFCVKNNEDIYYELNKETYDALNSKKKDWVWEMYTPFNLLWTLTGDEKEVEKTNYNIVLIQERDLKRLGLRAFLRGNYLKFYKP